MKNILFGLIISVVLLTGCSTGGETVTCTVNGKSAEVVLNNGLISMYKIDGKQKNPAEIAEINGEYFTSATNNEEGKEALKVYMQSIGGSCE